MKYGLLLLVSAPSGAGKTSLVDAALKLDPGLVASVSHTTRNRRPKEKDGVNYHFVETCEFEAMAEKGEFLEHATVFGNRYGTSRTEVAAQRALGRDVVLEIDWQGAAQVRKLDKNAVSIFILPPSKSALKERLEQRGQDSPESITKRLSEAELEMSQAHRYHYVLVNDKFEVALNELLSIVTAERLKTAVQLANNEQVKALLDPAG